MHLNPADFSVSTYSTGGPWVPRQNGVTVTYTPTGDSESCDENRGQHANRAEAWKRLIARLTTDNKQMELFNEEIYCEIL